VIIFGLRFAFFTHNSGEKTHSFKIRALKKRNEYRQLKRSYFIVEKCETEENLSKFLNNLAYKAVTSMRDCVMRRNFMSNLNSFYFDNMLMFYNQNKSCVKSCQKNA